MLKPLLRIGLLITTLLVSLAAVAKMTDQQVIDYIKRQSAIGKTEQQIGKELLAKGVTPEQIERLRAQYDTETDDSKNKNGKDKTDASTKGAKLQGTRESRLRAAQAPDEETIGRMNSVFAKMAPDSLAYLFETDSIIEKKIFGHDVFSNKSLSFEPNENMATPSDYRLGPGDEVIIDVWGASEDQIREIISPEGSIIVEQIGPVNLNGLTIDQANKRVRQLFASKYAGVADEETDVNLTLGQIRSILVNVMGEVKVPGSYRLSPFSTVFNALYRAGGINDIGSLRNINVLRDGRRIMNVDVYDYLFGGKGGNVRLQEGDVIIVPPYEELVNVEGNVKRPMYYELRDGETLAKLLEYTGGFAGDAYTDHISVSRQTGKENEIFNVANGEYASYKLKDGDIVNVGAVVDRFANRIELRGAVNRPGMYAITPNTSTLSQILKSAEGLSEGAYLDRAIIYREGDDLTLEAVSVALGDVMNGKAADIPLRRNDIVMVYDVKEVMDQGELTINGQVTNPGDYPYAEGITVEDLIVMAGGLMQGASTARVDVARRILNPESLTPTEQTAEVFSFALRDGHMLKGDPNFKLMPYDIVEIRQSPGYVSQQLIEIDGGVLFGGEYALQRRNERLSEIINRAGGIIDGAYLRGARLMRKMTEEEVAARDESVRLALQNNEDSISMSQLNLTDLYSVGIDLEKALEKPGSYYDVVLRDGDKLTIPEEVTTVKISGDVMYPNVVGYVPGKKLGYYIDQAGGYGERARKNKAFIVYMNGTVARAKRGSTIEPGCQIIVPSKPKNGGTNWAQILGYVSSFTSLGTMAATIYSIFKK